MRRGAESLRTLLTLAFAAPLSAAICVMFARVGDRARFVTWPVVAFTTFAALVALIGVWTGTRRPGPFAVGVLPALVLSYVLPAAPLTVVVVILAALAGAAVTNAGLASGAAGTTGALMVLLVLLEDPVVACGRSSVSATSGPWWIKSSDSSFSAGSESADGDPGGTTHVGDHQYRYRCRNGVLVEFDRDDTATAAGQDGRR